MSPRDRPNGGGSPVGAGSPWPSPSRSPGYIGFKLGGPVDAVGPALIGYRTDLGSLALMGLISGALLGAAQGLVLAHTGRHELVCVDRSDAALFALGWSATSAGGISVEEQFTVFGAYGATLFMLLSGLLLARFSAVRSHVAAVSAPPSRRSS